MTFLLSLHSLWRWVVVIVGLIAVVRLVLGLVQKKQWTQTDTRWSLFFSVSMDIQILLGLILLVVFFSNGGGMTRQIGEHLVMMILALVAVHVPAMWRAKPDAVRFRNTLIAFALSLVFVFLGVASVGGWSRLLAPM